MALAILALMLLPGPVRAEIERPIRVSPIVGSRAFAAELQLHPEFAFGARVSIGVSKRVSVAIDAGHSSPVRRTSGESMSFGEVRLLTLVRALRGPVSPYAVLGVGGQYFNFHDTPGTASGVAALGLGLDVAPRGRLSFFAEGSADFYRANIVGGSPYQEPRETLATGVFSIGVAYGF